MGRPHEELGYLGWLARRVPPARLGQVVATRLIRSATRVLPERLRPSAAEIFEAFCAQDAADLALKLCAARASRLWADASRRKALARAALEQPGVFQRVMRRAEAASRLDFEIFGRRVTFDPERGGVDWTLDPLSGLRAPDAIGFDPKGAWVLGRLDHLVALAQGIWLSPLGEVRDVLIDRLIEQIADFTRQNPAGEGIQWRAPMEVALRSVNLCLAFLMTRHRPEWQRRPSACLSLIENLWAGGRFVEANLESDTAIPNNHLVAGLVGLLHLGVLFPELPEAARWRARASAGLCREIEAQTLPDGFGFEGSTGYHRLSTELFTLALFAADAGRIELGQSFKERLRDRFLATAKLIDPQGRAPQIGDNDSGRALPLTSRAALDHGYLLPLGAALFGDAELRREGFDYCDEALFLMGPAGRARFDALAETVAIPQSTLLPDAGIALLRAGPFFCSVSAGPNGQAGVGGHGHNDKLGLEVHLRGERLIADPGSPCYTSDLEVRDRYRSTAAHATLQIDGEEQSPLPPGRPFALPDVAHARITHFESGALRDRLVATHRGYRRLPGALTHVREIVLDRARKSLWIEDRVEGSGRHALALRFPVCTEIARNDRSSQLPEEKRVRLSRHLHALELLDEVSFDLLGALSGERLGVTLFLPRGARIEVQPFAIAHGYGEQEMGWMIEANFDAEAPVTLCSAILF
ncbi:MAG: heparinase II/III family protein [Myxococcales bacterium]|jgi:hypothetical protein|nr:heparinase II/III family protein [Myxococcales bacterium]